MIETDTSFGTFYKWSSKPLIDLGALNSCALYWKNKEGQTYIGLGEKHMGQLEGVPSFVSCTFEGDYQEFHYDLTLVFNKDELSAYALHSLKNEFQGIPLKSFLKDELFKEPQTNHSFKATFKGLEPSPSFETWSQWVNESLESPKIIKSVLCRQLPFQSEDFSANTFDFFLSLKEAQDTNLFYCFMNEYQFMSFTPESLLKREGSSLYLEAIAGTHLNDGDEEELMNDPKEIHEHLEVLKKIEKVAREFGEVVLGEIELLRLKTISHLRTPITVSLKNSNLNLKDLTLALHPTPAVGGTPQEYALKHIAKCEGERHLYAGVLGVIDKDYAELAVLIRSLKRVDDTFVAFGGAGIVKGSTPEKEWVETLNKVKSFLPKDIFHQFEKEKA